jgi:dethiobiotin synthetase
MNYFITGTDTGIGKTFVTSLLVRGLRKAGLDAVGMKPICCGDRADAELLVEAADNQVSVDEINPWWLQVPASPYTASMVEERMIDVPEILRAYSRLRKAHRSVLVEGVGGWMVPIRRDYFVSDLAADIGLPVVVVVGNRLGALNHALLTVQSIKASGQTCAGIILNQCDPEMDLIAGTTNRAVLEHLLDVPILFEIQRDQKQIELAVA